MTDKAETSPSTSMVWRRDHGYCSSSAWSLLTQCFATLHGFLARFQLFYNSLDVFIRFDRLTSHMSIIILK